MEKLESLEITIANINDFREEIKRGINMGNTCYYSRTIHQKIILYKSKLNQANGSIPLSIVNTCKTNYITVYIVGFVKLRHSPGERSRG